MSDQTFYRLQRRGAQIPITSTRWDEDGDVRTGCSACRCVADLLAYYAPQPGLPEGRTARPWLDDADLVEIVGTISPDADHDHDSCGRPVLVVGAVEVSRRRLVPREIAAMLWHDVMLDIEAGIEVETKWHLPVGELSAIVAEWSGS